MILSTCNTPETSSKMFYYIEDSCFEMCWMGGKILGIGANGNWINWHRFSMKIFFFCDKSRVIFGIELLFLEENIAEKFGLMVI